MIVCIQTWRAGPRDPAGPLTHGPSSTLQSPETAARLRTPLVLRPESDRQRTAHRHTGSVFEEILKRTKQNHNVNLKILERFI